MANDHNLKIIRGYTDNSKEQHNTNTTKCQLRAVSHNSNTTCFDDCVNIHCVWKVQNKGYKQSLNSSNAAYVFRSIERKMYLDQLQLPKSEEVEPTSIAVTNASDCNGTQ
eukprot:6083066-Amphidinium_carterae.1